MGGEGREGGAREKERMSERVTDTDRKRGRNRENGGHRDHPYRSHTLLFAGLLFVCGHNAGNKMDFTRGKLKPKSASSILQAIICRFFCFNSVILVNL